MTLSAQAKPAHGETLTDEQQDLLARAGECSGAELIRRLFWMRFPGRSYRWWASRHGFSYSLTKAVIAQKRPDLGTSPKARAVRAALANDLGLPEWMLFSDVANHAPSVPQGNGGGN